MNEYWKQIFGWSWSRQATWDTCKLRYYYSYIGKWEGFKGDVNREKLHWLSRKSNRFVLEGQLIHEAIESQMNQWAIGRPVSKDAAKNLFTYRLRQIQQSPREFLIDEINGFPIPKERYEESRQSGLELLDSFFDIIWPNYAVYRYLKHEEFDSFTIDGFKVLTKVDLVTQMENGTIVVTDWKSGKIGEPAREQLLGYILWAIQAYKVDMGHVRAEVRYLRDPGGKPFIIEATTKMLQDFRDFIVRSSKEMLSVSSEADFPASPSERVCRECAFASICPEGMAHIPQDARSTPIIAAVSSFRQHA